MKTSLVGLIIFMFGYTAGFEITIVAGAIIFGFGLALLFEDNGRLKP